jgi:hypothetical protein
LSLPSYEYKEAVRRCEERLVGQIQTLVYCEISLRLFL